MRAVIAAATGGALPYFVVSVAAWIVMLGGAAWWQGADGTAWTLCASPGGSTSAPLDPGNLAATGFDALLMLCAMAPPLLWLPLRHLHARTLSCRQGRATALFLFGYAAVWLGALALLWTFAGLLYRHQAATGTLIAIGAAVVWQGTAMKARALLRCHALPTLAAFGAAAELASLRFGAASGLWCAQSCGPFMLAAMAVPAVQAPGMIIAAAVATAERYRRPLRPRSKAPLLLGGMAMLALAAL